MKKILFILILLIPSIAFALEVPDIHSNKFLIYDLTDDKILQEKGLTDQTSIASLTKIVTTIVAIEKNPDLNKKIVITSIMLAGIPSDASVAGLKVGDNLSIMDLLYASMLPSGADATQVLAFISSGSVKEFVNSMNELAKKVGATNTNFVNVTGYDINNHYSTLDDLVKIIKYALNNETFKTIFETKEYTLSNSKKIYSTIKKYNESMGLDTSRIIGSKTGYTGSAGICIAATIKSSNHDILIITLGAPYVYGNFYNLKDALDLTEFVDKNYKNEILSKKGDFIKTLPIEYSKSNKFDIVTNSEIVKFLPIDYDKSKFSVKYSGKEVLSYKDKKDEVIGEINYYYDNELLDTEKVILTINIKKDYFKLLYKNRFQIMSIIGIISLIIIFTLCFRKKLRK